MVKCADCGFLAARNQETRKLEEVEEQSRKDGNIGKQRYVLIPVCLARSINIKEEAKKLWHMDTRNPPEPLWTDYVKAILDKERRCDPFVKWHQGFDPKEHREMLDRQEFRDWQAKQHKNDRRWRIIEIVILVLLAGIFTLLGAFISRGS